MLYTKPIEQITFEDVVSFCAERHRESVNLDYKREIDTGISRTIAAMANTWGGLILVGVDEDDSRPRLPIQGVPYEEHLRERINNIILGNITPPAFPEIQVCQSQDGQRALIVVRIAQSNLTPHAIRNNTRVYLRTDTSNEPETLASLDQVVWLADRRKKSSELKTMLVHRAKERWKLLCTRAEVERPVGELTLVATPLYPHDALVEYRRLRDEIPSGIIARGWGTSSFPPDSMRGLFVPGKDGALAFLKREHNNYVAYEELDEHGLFLHREDIVLSERTENNPVRHIIYLNTLLTRLDLFIESMGMLYRTLGFWGLIEVTVSLQLNGNVEVIRLPPPRNHYYIDDERGIPVDRELTFSRQVGVRELIENRPELVAGLMSEIGWAVGFPHITEESVRVLLREAGRMQ